MKRIISCAVLTLALAVPGAALAADAGSLFKSRCQPCHGPEAKGTAIAPGLANSQFVRDASREEIAQTITKGRQGADRKYPQQFPAGMPPQKLSDEEVSQLIDYLKGLQGK
ncbi:MAG: cytochrome c [Deltaproteobacteria bacterium]|nr:cytochrome c [Deltaproteobacteria bacterium]MCL4873755.1 c-type cytochrome [bacterium]